MKVGGPGSPILQENPERIWPGYECGADLYWRLEAVNTGGVLSGIQGPATVQCSGEAPAQSPPGPGAPGPPVEAPPGLPPPGLPVELTPPAAPPGQPVGPTPAVPPGQPVGPTPAP